MVERPDPTRLTEILKAATDPTRRAILTLLAQEGPTRVTEIAARFEMSLNAISKHIKVLQGAGLVSRRTLWREHLIEVQLAPLAEIDRWFHDLRSIWALRLEALETLLSEEEKMTDLALTVTRLINAPIDKVFNAWLDPVMLARFMIPGDGMSVPHCTTDPRVGGRFAITMKAGDQELPHAGTYTEITPHSRIAFTWESPHSIDGSTVTLSFGAKDQGTEVTLHHVKFASAESRDNHEKGWGAILGSLAAAVARTKV
jgi:uncharacterized protein YndB with AHSA1/START domain